MVGILFSVNPLIAQTENIASLPKAIVYLKNNTPNAFIEAVSILASDDPILTEKSVREIQSIKQNGNLQLISEQEYDLLPENRKKNFTTRRDILEIIEKLKSKS